MVPMNFHIYFIDCLLGNHGVQEISDWVYRLSAWESRCRRILISAWGLFPPGNLRAKQQKQKSRKSKTKPQNRKCPEKQKIPKTTKSAERIWARNRGRMQCFAFFFASPFFAVSTIFWRLTKSALISIRSHGQNGCRFCFGILLWVASGQWFGGFLKLSVGAGGFVIFWKGPFFELSVLTS